MNCFFVLFCFEICFRLQILSKMLKTNTQQSRIRQEIKCVKVAFWYGAFGGVVYIQFLEWLMGTSYQIIGCSLGSSFFSPRLEASSCLLPTVSFRRQKPTFFCLRIFRAVGEGTQTGSRFPNLAKLSV